MEIPTLIGVSRGIPIRIPEKPPRVIRVPIWIITTIVTRAARGISVILGIQEVLGIPAIHLILDGEINLQSCKYHKERDRTLSLFY